jgi:peptide subunit release factor RF-3
VFGLAFFLINLPLSFVQMLAAVGVLQFEVVQARLENEYKVE